MDTWDYYSTSDRSRTTSRVRSTFMVEALLLLTCVIILLAVTISLFAFASETSTRAQRIQESADIAQNAAEQFAANPAGMPEVQHSGDYIVRCDINEEDTEAGHLYNARVIVIHGINEMCSLDVSQYVSNPSVATATSGGAVQGGTPEGGSVTTEVQQ